MARTVFEDPVRELHGAYTKGGSISRRKTYRDSKGRIKGMSEPETYKIAPLPIAFMRCTFMCGFFL